MTTPKPDTISRSLADAVEALLTSITAPATGMLRGVLEAAAEHETELVRRARTHDLFQGPRQGGGMTGSPEDVVYIFTDRQLELQRKHIHQFNVADWNRHESIDLQGIGNARRITRESGQWMIDGWVIDRGAGVFVQVSNDEIEAARNAAMIPESQMQRARADGTSLSSLSRQGYVRNTIDVTSFANQWTITEGDETIPLREYQSRRSRRDQSRKPPEPPKARAPIGPSGVRQIELPEDDE
jgi:hypothetical protein